MVEHSSIVFSYNTSQKILFIITLKYVPMFDKAYKLYF